MKTNAIAVQTSPADAVQTNQTDADATLPATAAVVTAPAPTNPDTKTKA